MQPSSKISTYLKSICEQIRWKKAHSVITKEIEDHIIDQVNAYKAEGMDEDTAVDSAIREMGDPIMVGTQFDRTYRPKIEWSIILMTCMLLLIGLAARALTGDLSVERYGNQHYLIIKQIIHTFIGVVCLLAAYFIDYTIIGKYPRAIFFSLMALSIAVFIVSPLYNGQKYYAKYMMLLFPTAFTGIIYWTRTKGYIGILLCGVAFALPCLLGLLIPSVSGIFIYSLTCLVLLTYAILKGWFSVKLSHALLLVYGSVAVITVCVFLIAIVNEPYRMARLRVMLDPSTDPRGMGYMAIMTRDILSHSKLIGQGASAHFAVLEADTDFVLTYIIHRFGWIAFFAIMALLAGFILRSFILCLRQKSIMGRLVSVSVFMTFTLEVAVYVANNLGFQVLSPLSLPLISYGGTATLINMFLIGFMLSVFRLDQLVKDSVMPNRQTTHKFIEINEGKIIIHYK